MALPESASPPRPCGQNSAPEYPSEAQSAGVQATVVAKIVVKADGSVGEINILRGHPLLDESVRRALRGWCYTPAHVEGHPIAVFHIVRVPFHFEGAE